MDLLKDNIKTIYFRYLAAAFGSALITSVYSVVDMAMVGQYHGPDGTAALAVIAPVWNVIYSLGLLTGIGGSVLFSMRRGQRAGENGAENEYFTVSVGFSAVLAVFTWAAILLFEKPILTFFGADETLLPMAVTYLKPVLFVFPAFLLTQMLAAFLRNDNNPGLATAGVLAGGIFNMIGDYVFVFTFDLGIFGAGLATAIGSVLSLVVMLSHFVSKKNTLKLVKIESTMKKVREITVTGFSTFFIDVAMGILTILFNRQIMRYLGSDALAVYGPIINISTFVQCCAYSVGQAAQPIISTNYGARKGGRIREALRCSLYATAFFSIFWTALSLACPNLYIRIFMTPTARILEIAPRIIRSYAISFLLLPLNIYSTYYFQALLKPKAAFLVSVARGLVISGLLILILPVACGPDSIRFAMPVTELVTAIYAITAMRRYTHTLPEERNIHSRRV